MPGGVILSGLAKFSDASGDGAAGGGAVGVGAEGDFAVAHFAEVVKEDAVALALGEVQAHLTVDPGEHVGAAACPMLFAELPFFFIESRQENATMPGGQG